MQTNRYVDGNYTTINSGDRFWTSQYYYSNGTMKASSVKGAIEVMMDDYGNIVNVPGHKGRKLSKYYWGNLFTTKELAEAHLQEQMNYHLDAIINRLDITVKSIQAACTKVPMLRGTSKFNDLKKALQDYAQVL